MPVHEDPHLPTHILVEARESCSVPFPFTLRVTPESGSVTEPGARLTGCKPQRSSVSTPTILGPQKPLWPPAFYMAAR